MLSTTYQATNNIFQRTKTNNFTIRMEIQKKEKEKKKKNSNSQRNLEKEEWNGRIQPA